MGAQARRSAEVLHIAPYLVGGLVPFNVRRKEKEGVRRAEGAGVQLAVCKERCGLLAAQRRQSRQRGKRRLSHRRIESECVPIVVVGRRKYRCARWPVVRHGKTADGVRADGPECNSLHIRWPEIETARARCAAGQHTHQR